MHPLRAIAPPALIALAAATACASRARDVAPLPPVEGRSAALARVTVDNRTDRRLLISFETVAPPIESVVVGDIAPRTRASLAPVPAQEPIVLQARPADSSSRLRLPPRAFDMGERWVWLIPEDAVFREKATPP